MRALTVRQPWASLLMFAGKGIDGVENRTRKPTSALLGQRISIHAGLTLDDDAMANLWERGLWPTRQGLDQPLGVILGTMKLIGWCTRDGVGEYVSPAAAVQCMNAIKSPWANPESEWYWVLRDPIALATPIPCKGALGLWRVPVEYEPALRALEAA